MSQKVNKLLRKYSTISDKNISELKLWWKSISHNKKYKERLRINKELKS